MTTEPHIALAFLESRFDGKIPDDLRRAAERGELAVSPSTMPASVRISIQTHPEQWPADVDAFKRELLRAAGFIIGVPGHGLIWALSGKRSIALEFSIAAGTAVEPMRLRGALGRIARVHCGGASKIEFGGALAI